MVNNSAVDDLLYFTIGAAAGKLAKVLSVKYGDPKPNLNIASLKGFGKPSAYIPGTTGAAALGYAAYQADKFGRLKSEEVALAGYGVFALVDTVADLLTPAAVPPAAVRARSAGSGIRVVNGGGVGAPQVTGAVLRGAV